MLLYAPHSMVYIAFWCPNNITDNQKHNVQSDAISISTDSVFFIQHSGHKGGHNVTSIRDPPGIRPATSRFAKKGI